MLTVVQDYIRDSLSLNKEENVNSISTGEYTILIEAGPRAIISLVVRGTPDTIVRDKMAEAIENIHLRLSGALSTFSGNTELFEKEEALLRPCLISREKGDKKKKPVYAIIALMIIGALITAITVFSFSASLNSRIFLEALNNEKGILIASHYRRGGKTEVRLLRDARARKIDEIAAGYSIDIEKFIFAEEEFISPLFGPAYVSADRAIPDELLALARRLKGYILFFEQDSGELRIGQEETVREAGTLITEIIDKAKESGFKVNVELTGHTAGNIQDPDSLRISRERAEKAMKLFEDLNAPLAQYVTPRGVGISEPVAQDEATDEERILNRSVTFKAVFE
ncbi:MAG: hypothetical protein RBT69_02365 [Spirochaetia bacterium]|jgi:flagellar motor protein MotB|nr:hypothetical protein [Spirochaetia bacterium]